MVMGEGEGRETERVKRSRVLITGRRGDQRGKEAESEEELVIVDVVVVVTAAVVRLAMPGRTGNHVFRPT